MRAIVLLVGVLAPALVHAQSFEATADAATKVHRIDDLLWAFVGACDNGDDIQQRQCRLVRDKRAKELVGKSLVIEGEADALEVSKWSPQKRSLGMAVTACIRCAGVEVEGKKYFVIGAGTAPRWEGTKLRAQVLLDNTKMFNDEASATAWRKSVENARVQYIVRVPEKPKWKSNNREGLSLEVLAYRVFAPCDGSIVASKPESQPLPPDKKACGGLPVVVDPAPTGGKPERLPDGLTGAMIKAAMKPVLDAANACFDRYKVSGKAKLVMVVAGDGSVTSYEQQGELVGTPIAPCIDTAAKKVKFPKTQRASTKIGYPIVLR